MTGRSLFLTAILLPGVVFISFCSGQTYDNMTQLRQDLLTGYDRGVIPKLNQSEPLYINVSMTLYGILEVNSVKGVLSLVLSLSCFWYDERMVWTPADYGGIDKVIFSLTDIWYPTIALGTPIEFTEISQSWNKLVVESTGLTWLFAGDVIKSSCSMNMKYWPYDKQICKVSFLSVGYIRSSLEMLFSERAYVNYNALINNEWIIEDVTYEHTYRHVNSAIVYTFKLRRHPSFYGISIVAPLVGLFIMSSFVFLLPQESGERIGYSITMMLAIAVFLTVVADEMPKSGDPSPLICIFIILGFANSLAATLLIILSMIWYYNSEKKPLKCWHKLLIKITACKSVNNLKCNYGDSQVAPHESHANDKELEANTHRSLNQFSKNQSLEAEFESLTLDSGFTWQGASKALDIISFVFFFLLSVIQFFTFYFMLSTGSHYDESYASDV